MVNPTIGQAVNAKQSQRQTARAWQIQAPFIEVREPRITPGGEQKQAASACQRMSRIEEAMAKRRVEPPAQESRVFAGARL